MAKKKKNRDERIAIMVDKAAGCLDLTASKKNQIVASQSLSIADANDVESAVADAVDAFCQQHQLNCPACTIMLPASSYQMLLVEAPPVSEQELADALQWKVKDLLNKAMEESIIDGFLLPEDAYRGRQKMAYTVVADRVELQAVANSLNNINVELDRIEVPELVLLGLLTQNAKASEASAQLEPQNEMIVVIGRERGFLAVVANQALYFSRPLDISDNALQNDTHIFSTNGQVDNFILEMQRSRDYFESQIGKGTIARILLAPLNSDASLISKTILERLGISVELVAQSSITDFTLASKGAETLLLASAAQVT